MDDQGSTQVLNTTISSVEPRVVTRRSDGVQITLWEVTDGSGVVWVARKDVANIARQLIGHPVTMIARTQHKGEYVNRYLDAVELNGGSQPVGPPPIATQAVQTAMAAQQTLPTQPTQPGLSEKDRQIHRQTAAKVAAVLQAPGDGMLDFWANARALANYFDTGFVPLFMEQDSRPQGETPPKMDWDDPEIPF